MLTEAQTSALRSMRESYYMKNISYGEAFDFKFMDVASNHNVPFHDCLDIAKKDTEQHIFLEEIDREKAQLKHH